VAHLDPRARRALGRTLTRLARASVAESLNEAQHEAPTRATPTCRVGFTGAPGAGKSTLISRLARQRIASSGGAANIAILSIDPSSPISGGAILGDRIRMDNIANEPELFIRSVSSRSSSDGLADNLPDLIAATESYGFGEVLIETVGVGQAEQAVRQLVDTLIMVVQPQAGDAIQAMKAGILELADLYVVNKADLAGAGKTAAELRGVLALRRDVEGGWVAPVIEVSSAGAQGLAELDTGLRQHQEWLREHRDPEAVRAQRRRYHVQSLLIRRVAELLDDDPALLDADALRARYRAIIGALGDDAGRS
jgi:LAO/AO transport system kinase